jgi:hypothetical protein
VERLRRAAVQTEARLGGVVSVALAALHRETLAGTLSPNPNSDSSRSRGGADIPEVLRPAGVQQAKPELTNRNFFWDPGKPRAKAP